MAKKRLKDPDKPDNIKRGIEDPKKIAMIEALTKTLGVVTSACQMVGIHRSTYYDWMEKDKDFEREVNEIKEIALDFVESKLYKKIDEMDITSIIFYLKTKGKARGYVERVEVETGEKREYTIEIVRNEHTDDS
jgi:predicted transcriptional regulator